MAKSQLDLENISKSDLTTILEVNKNSIELNVEVQRQNEKILTELNGIAFHHAKEDDKLNRVMEKDASIEAELESLSEIIVKSSGDVERIREIQDNIFDQYDKMSSMIDAQEKASSKLVEKIDAIGNKLDASNRTLTEIKEANFRLQVLLGSGILGIIFQIIEILTKK